MSDTTTDSEPPRKRKRRSKWGIKPEGVEGDPPAPAPPPGPKAAEAAAAKINAMLASQGKLAKSDPPPYKPVLPPTRPQSQTFSGAGTTPSSGGGGLLSTPLIPPNPSLAAASSNSHSGPHYVQDKVFVGMAKAPSTFNIKEKLEGQNGSFLMHIATQTGAKVFLRGQGSGYIEPTSKKESFEALHIYISHCNQKGLESARKLCESLIQTVQSEYDNFMASQQVQQPLGFGGDPNFSPQAPYANPYQQLYPPPPPGSYPPPAYPLMNQQLPPPPSGPPGPPYGHYGPPPGHPHHPGNFPPPHPNAGPPPQGPGYYPAPPPGMHPHPGGVPPPGPYPYPPSAPVQMHQPPPEPAKPNLFSEFKRFDREPEKRKFQEAPVASSVLAPEGSKESDSPHFSSTNTGTEASSDDGRTGGAQPLQDGGGDVNKTSKNDSLLEAGKLPNKPGARVFKEEPAASSKHSEESPLPSSNFKKPRSFKELPMTANGEVTGPSDKIISSGKWESLHGASTVVSALDSKGKGSKEVKVATKEPEPVFAQPTLRPRDMDAMLMPPPKIPGPSQLMKRAKAILAEGKGLVAKSEVAAGVEVASKSEVVASKESPVVADAKKPEGMNMPTAKPTGTDSAVVSAEPAPKPQTKAFPLVSYSSEEDSDSDAE